MAFGGGLVWEIQTGGSDTLNGGGFDPALSGNQATDLKTSSGTIASPVMTSATYNFVSAQDLNNWLFVKQGTNWNTGWFKMTAVSSNAATVDASTGNWIDLNTYAPSTTQGIVTSSYVSNTASGNWSVDYSQGTAVTLTVTIASTTTFTSTPTAGKNTIGNIIFLSNAGASGATVQRYQIVSSTGTTATVDKTFGVASGSPTTVTMGGPLASPGQQGALHASGHIVFVKSGTYSITSASTNIAGGCPSYTPYVQFVGYGSKRGDLGTTPVLQASGISSAVLFTAANGVRHHISNIIIDGASLSTITGFKVSDCTVFLCTAKNCTNKGFTVNTTAYDIFFCRATGCGTTSPAIDQYNLAFACVADSNTVTGFVSTDKSWSQYCIACNNSGASSDGFTLTGDQVGLANNVAYNNGRHGFFLNGHNTVLFNNIAVNNGGYGYKGTGDFADLLINNAGCSNTSGLIDTTTIFPRFTWGMVTLNTGATSAVVSAAGSGYAVGDILKVSGGTSAQAATFAVATLSGSGVATVTLVNPGSYSAAPANAAATTHVTGSGNDACTLTVTYNGNIVFNNAGGNDFSLSNVPGAGGACRQAGVPGALAANKFPGLSTNSYPAIGAAIPVYPLTGAEMGGGIN